MSSNSNKMLFAAAMMLSAVSAADDVSKALNKLQRATQDHTPISPRRRFNLEAVLPPIVEEQLENEEYWRPAEHEYEPPEHDPKQHEPMPTGPVDTYHSEPISQKSHPTEEQHRTHTVPPKNYFYEEPVAPISDEREEDAQHLQLMDHDGDYVEAHHLSREDEERMVSELEEELKNRHLGHKYIRQPIWQKTSLSDVNDTQLHTLGVSQLVETVYDDLSSDSVLYTQTTDHKVETNIGLMPDEDGILKTFIDRYTTMLIHDSVFMEEMPAPQFMHHSLSILNPAVVGGLKHDPRLPEDVENVHHVDRTYVPEKEENDFIGVGEHIHQPSLHRLLREADEDRHMAHPNLEPTAAQVRNQPQDTFDIDNYYHVSQSHGFPIEEGYHPERAYYDHHEPEQRRHHYQANTLQGELAKEGARHMGDTLGMHFKQPLEQQIVDREVESAHRHAHHATTRYEPEHFNPHHDMEHAREHGLDHEYAVQAYHDTHDLDAHYHRDLTHHAVEHGGPHDLRYSHGLPVHDRYGERAIEHDPYHHEFVHGTNYEIGTHHMPPVMEHNPHAYGAAAQPAQKSDVTKLPPPKQPASAGSTSTQK